MSVPNGYAEIVAAYGDTGFDGHTVSSHWEEANMVVARDLPLVPMNAKGERRLYVHRLIETPLRAALSACEALGDGYLIHRLGCFAPRFQRGSESLVSIHTFGAAVDLNPDSNPLYTPRPQTPTRGVHYDIPDTWIEAFRAQGFMWGGDFKRRFDGMHFQLATGF